MKSHILKVLACCVFLVCAMANAQVYKWLDEAGNVHFGDKPPATIKAEALDMPEVKASPTPVVTDQERKERTRRLLQALEEERLEKQKAKEVQKKKEQKRLAYCKKLLGKVKDSERISRYYHYDENGDRQYASDKEADGYRQYLKETYQAKCAH